MGCFVAVPSVFSIARGRSSVSRPARWLRGLLRLVESHDTQRLFDARSCLAGN